MVIAIPVLSYVIEQFSWHWAFGLLGIVGLAWVVVWYLLGREGSVPAGIVDQSGYRIERVPYSRLLLNGTVLSAFAAGFGSYWGIALLVGWFTPYLIDGNLGYTQTQAGWITTAVGNQPLHLSSSPAGSRNTSWREGRARGSRAACSAAAAWL